MLHRDGTSVVVSSHHGVYSILVMLSSMMISRDNWRSCVPCLRWRTQEEGDTGSGENNDAFIAFVKVEVEGSSNSHLSIDRTNRIRDKRTRCWESLLDWPCPLSICFAAATVSLRRALTCTNCQLHRLFLPFKLALIRSLMLSFKHPVMTHNYSLSSPTY